MKCSYSYCKHPAVHDVMSAYGTVMHCCGEHLHRLVREMSGHGQRIVQVAKVGTFGK